IVCTPRRQAGGYAAATGDCQARVTSRARSRTVRTWLRGRGAVRGQAGRGLTVGHALPREWASAGWIGADDGARRRGRRSAAVLDPTARAGAGASERPGAARVGAPGDLDGLRRLRQDAARDRGSPRPGRRL